MNYSSEQRAEEMQLAIVELWQESGLSKYAFCKQEKLSRSTFNYWLERFGHSLASLLRKQRTSLSSKTKNTASFVTVNLESTPSDATPAIELEYPNGVKLRLPPGFTHEQLRLFIMMY